MKDPLDDVQIAETRRGSFAVLAVILGLFAWLFVAQPWIAAMILGIVGMVMLHEVGHFIAARRSGMLATEFFLGFGPRLWSFRRGETEYGVKAILLGGYVKIIGMSNIDKVEPELEPRAYRQAPARRRLLVALAGVAVNVALAFVLIFVSVVGQGETYEGPGTSIQAVVRDSAAVDAGMEPGDEFVAIDGIRVESWEQLKALIEERGGDETVFTVRRDGTQLELLGTPRTRDGEGFLGVSPAPTYRPIGAFAAVGETFDRMWAIVEGTGDALGRLVSPAGISDYSKNFTEDAPAPGSPQDLERPRSLVGIVDLGSDQIAGDVWALIYLLGGISLALALFNVLPFLPFDGGHAVIAVYESIATRVRGREVRVDIRKLIPLTTVVFALILMLGFSAMFLDIRDAVR